MKVIPQYKDMQEVNVCAVIVDCPKLNQRGMWCISACQVQYVDELHRIILRFENFGTIVMTLFWPSNNVNAHLCCCLKPTVQEGPEVDRL